MNIADSRLDIMKTQLRGTSSFQGIGSQPMACSATVKVLFEVRMPALKEEDAKGTQVYERCCTIRKNGVNEKCFKRDRTRKLGTREEENTPERPRITL